MTGASPRPEWRAYLQAALAGERRAALAAVRDSLRAGASVPEVYRGVLQPAQEEVGRLWEGNEITVAGEHVATAVTQYVMAVLYDSMELPETTRGNGLVTGVQGELHQIGAHMVADVLEASGWRMRFLGTQLPHGDVLRAIEDHEPGLVGISATLLANVPAVGDLIEAVRRSFGDARIVVGGSAFLSAPDLWRELGADGFGRDLRHARALVDTLIPPRPQGRATR